MAAIQFYHLTATPLERALPKLLEKAHGSNYRILLVAADEARAEKLNDQLWNYSPESFLPHGTQKDGYAEVQPILLSHELDAKNAANLLVVTDGRTLVDVPFERVLDIFDGNDDAATQAARERWSAYKDAGFEISYLKQTEQGSWEKKA